MNEAKITKYQKCFQPGDHLVWCQFKLNKTIVLVRHGIFLRYHQHQYLVWLDMIYLEKANVLRHYFSDDLKEYKIDYCASVKYADTQNLTGLCKGFRII